MPIDQCPQAEELSGFVLGTLDPALAEPIVEHLDTCSLCEQTVHQLEAEGGSIVEQLRATPTADSFEAEAGYQQALERIEAIGREPSFNTQMQQLQAENEQVELGSIGHYQLLARLGAGGMGTVYKALHTRLDKVVALKILSEDKFRNPQAVARFDREMKAVGKLDHAHILRAMDAGEADGRHFLVTEYIEGCDLAQLSRNLGPLPIPEACELVRQAALGLQHAHEHNMVHRDIKPANLYLSVQRDHPPRVKILDLGLALTTDFPAADDDGDDLTGDGEIMGTLDYMAPEQAGDTHNVSIAADIYSLGATLYKLLTGHSVYYSTQKRSTMQKLLTLANETAPPIQSRRNNLPDDLAAVVHQMLDKDPESRHATPAKVARALEPFCTGQNLASLLQQPESQPTISTANPTATSNSASLHDSSVETQDEVSPHPGLQPTVISTADHVEGAETVLLPRAAGRGWGRWVLGGVAVAALMLGVILIQTSDGTIRIETNQTDVEVLVDGEKTVYITDPNDKTKISVKIPKGAKTLRVRKAGFVADTEKFEVETVKGPVKVSFVPVKEPAIGGDVDRQVAEWVLSIGGTIKTDRGEFKAIDELPKGAFHLTYIDLEDNERATDNQLERLRGLKHLRNLRIGGRQVSDVGVKHLAGLKSLMELHLNSTMMTDAGLIHLSGLTNMRTLDLGGTPIKGDGLKYLNQMTNLETLSCIYTSVGNSGLQHITNLKRLSEISLGGTKVSDAGLVHLSMLNNLTVLNLNQTSVTDAGMEHIQRLKSLRSLTLSRTRVSNAGLLYVKECRDLEMLLLGDTGVNGSGLEHLKGLPKLYLLGLDSTKVADVHLADLKGLKSLSNLILANTEIGDDGLEHLKRISNLKKLHLAQTNVSAQGIAALKKALPNCAIAWDGPAIWKPTKAQKAFLDRVAKLPAVEQVEAVRAKLREVNPGFDGAVTHKIEAGAVVEFSFVTDEVTEIWPVRGLQLLKYLDCPGSSKHAGKLVDLSALAGLQLVRLQCDYNNVKDLSPLSGMPLQELWLRFAKITDLSPLRGMKTLRIFCCDDTYVSDLAPLRGIPLTQLHCGATMISDLSVIEEMPLEFLTCRYTHIADVSLIGTSAVTQLYVDVPLFDESRARTIRSLKLTTLEGRNPEEFWQEYEARRQSAKEFAESTSSLPPQRQLREVDIRLRSLNRDHTSTPRIVIEDGAVVAAEQDLIKGTRDLSPLMAFTKLQKLTLVGEPIRPDLSGLKHVPIEELNCPDAIAFQNSGVLKTIATLKTINGKPSAEHWRGIGVPQEEGWKATPEQQAFLDRVAKLPAAEQVEAVRAKLKEVNPGFDGAATHKIEAGAVVEFSIVSDDVTEIWPVRGLMKLKTLICRGIAATGRGNVATPENWGKFANLAPLAGMTLESLHVTHTRLSNLSPLKGMPLKLLSCVATNISDLSPLEGMPLEKLYLSVTSVNDLSPIRGMPLKILYCDSTKVSDLRPLEEMKLIVFDCDSTSVDDLTPLKGMPLTELNIGNTKVTDLSPLEGMPLKSLDSSHTQVADLEPLRGMPLEYLSCARTNISDLAPLQGMSLETFACNNSRVADLTPLRGQPLKVLGFGASRVTDLTPLRGMDLPELSFPFLHVADLSTVKTMELKTLVIHVPLFDADAHKILNPLKMETVNGQHPSVYLTELETQRNAAIEFAKGTAELPLNKQLERVRKQLQQLNPGTGGEVRLGASIDDGAIVEGMVVVSGHSRAELSPLMGFTRLKKLTVSSDVCWPDLSFLKHLPLEELHCRHEIAFANSGVLKKMTSLKKVNGHPAAEYWEQIQEKLMHRDAQPVPGTKPWQPSSEQRKFLDGVAKLPVEKQVDAVREKLMEINPGFDGKLSHSIDSNNEVAGLTFNTDRVTQIWPVRAFRKLETLTCTGSDSSDPNRGEGALTDLSPLAGMRLIALNISSTQVTDISPLVGMPLRNFACLRTPLSSISALRGMAIESIGSGHSKLNDIAGLRGMPLHTLSCGATRVTDLTPIDELPLTSLSCRYTHVADISPVKSLSTMGPFFYFDVPLFDDERIELVRSLKQEMINGIERSEFVNQLETRRESALEFVKKTATLNAQAQLAAVDQELKRINNSKTLTPKGVIKDGQVTEVLLGLTHFTLDASPLMAFKQMKKLTLVGKPYWPDLSGLKHVPIEELNCPDAIAFQNSGVLKTIESLKTINGKPAADYWEELPERMKPVAK